GSSNRNEERVLEHVGAEQVLLAQGVQYRAFRQVHGESRRERAPYPPAGGGGAEAMTVPQRPQAVEVHPQRHQDDGYHLPLSSIGCGREPVEDAKHPMSPPLQEAGSRRPSHRPRPKYTTRKMQMLMAVASNTPAVMAQEKMGASYFRCMNTRATRMNFASDRMTSTGIITGTRARTYTAMNSSNV